MKRLIIFFLPLSLIVLNIGSSAKTGVTPDLALVELKAGNAHHVAHHYKHPHESAGRRRELTAGQHPHAQILGCADSRVPPEIVFDQGLGDLFVVRVAGNVASDVELASLEYGADHLHIPLLVVLGHQHCGAVTAAVEAGQTVGHLNKLIDLLRPAVQKSRSLPGDPVENAVKTNVEMVVAQLRRSTPVLGKLEAEGKLKIVGAIYSLDTGKVKWLSDSR